MQAKLLIHLLPALFRKIRILSPSKLTQNVLSCLNQEVLNDIEFNTNLFQNFYLKRLKVAKKTGGGLLTCKFALNKVLDFVLVNFSLDL